MSEPTGRDARWMGTVELASIHQLGTVGAGKAFGRHEPTRITGAVMAKNVRSWVSTITVISKAVYLKMTSALIVVLTYANWFIG